MQKLNLPPYQFKLIEEKGATKIFDSIRKKYVVLTPEEWVRQNFIEFLHNEKGFPKNLMAVEKQLVLNKKTFRFDLLIYNKKGFPFCIAEFKSPTIKITQETFNQVVRYNYSCKVDYVLVSNGMQHYACKIDYVKNKVEYLKEIPSY